MKRKLSVLIFFFVLLLVVGLSVQYLRNRTPKDGDLRVESVPVVSVFVDNKHVGRSPLKIQVSAGEHTVRLVSEDAQGSIAPWQGKISVGSSMVTFINAILSESELSSAIDVLWLEKSVAGQTELSVITNPDGASIIVDDATKGISPITVSDLSEGERTLTVTSPGFLNRTMKIRLTKGYKLIASLKLALSAAGAMPDDTDSVSTPSATTATGTPVPSRGSPTPTKKPTAVTTPKKPYVTIKETPTGFLRVREEPSTSASEAARVKPGEMYHLLDTKSGWYQIEYDGSLEGWISSQYAEKTE